MFSFLHFFVNAGDFSENSIKVGVLNQMSERDTTSDEKNRS